MAEFIMKDLVKKQGLEKQFVIASVATSMEELGNGVHRGTRRILQELGISCAGKTAVLLDRRDYDRYDYLIGMDGRNIRNIYRIIGQDSLGKVSRLLDFTDEPGDIADPWYTGDFEATCRDVQKGCRALLNHIMGKN